MLELAPVTLTVADALAVPPAPLQARANVVAAVSAPVLADPVTAFAPLQPPLAVHEVAFVLDQFSMAAAPLVTVAGVAVSVTVGKGLAATVTVAEPVAVPPLPVQLSPNVLDAESGPVFHEPLVAFAPVHAPDAVQLDAPVLLHVSVDAFPMLTLVGDALSESCGGEGPPDPTGLTSIPFTHASPATRVKTRLSVASEFTMKVRSATVLTGTT
jgi:hypothetical protein